MSKLTVVLRNVNNGRLINIEIESLIDGRIKVRENTEKFGSSEWYGYREAKKENRIGTVKYKGTPIARYSYNGRLWNYENNDCPVEINDNTLSALLARKK